MSEDIHKSDKHTVRLSTLNVNLRSKMAKFDSANDGELSVEDMLHAIVTLQKQSNNYKRMLYIILPVMIIVVASIFGTTMLALNLTKEMKVNSRGVLVGQTSTQVISTARAVEYTTLNEWLMSDNPDDLKKIKVIELPNMILPVHGVFVNTNQTTVILEQFYFIVNRATSSVEVQIKDVYKNDHNAKLMVASIEQDLQSFKSKIYFEGKFDLNNLLRLLTYYVEVEVDSAPEFPDDSTISGSRSNRCSPTGRCAL